MCGHKCITILLLSVHLITFLLSVDSLSSQELCQSNVCSGCIAGSLSCQEGGLHRLPDQLSPDIRSMILIGHNFDNPILFSTNFSNYPQQTKQLQRLVLRNCGIKRVEPGALQSLADLNQLDFSQNQLKLVETGTFTGLHLEFLRLDENPGLHLAPGAFRQTTIVSLSMNHCGLTSLSFEDLAPLFETGKLKNLHLSGNNLITLESQLEPVFVQLQSLSIEQNQFICDCSLRWLTDTLQRRAFKRSTRALSDSVESNFRASNAFRVGSDNSPFDGDLQKPVCNYPARLAGKAVEKLKPNDFYCELPRLTSLDLDMRQLGGLADSANPDILEATQNSNVEVILRCQVQGSPELQISWYRRLGHQTIAELGLTHELNDQFVEMPIQQSNIAGAAEVRVSPSNFSSNRKYEHLLCMARDLSGNASAEIRLQWPDINVYTNFPKKSKMLKSPQSVSDPGMPTLEKQASNENKHFLQNPSGQQKLRGKDPDVFWLHKQFSALQMIGAVVCTFTITLILFISGCCLLKAYRLHYHRAQSKLLLHHSASTQHLSTHGRSTAPPSYASDPKHSNTFARYPSTEKIDGDMRNTTNFTTTYQPIYGNHTSENGVPIMHTTGLSTMKRNQRPLYEPMAASENPFPAAYGESQTYDLPHFHSNFPTPTIPLPPVPSIHTQNPIDLANFQTTQLMCTNSPPTLNVDLTHLTNTTNGYHPMLINPTENISAAAAISMAATLNRLQNSPLVRGQLPPHTDSTINPHQFSALAAAQHQLFNFANRQNLYGPSQSNSETIT